MARNISAVETPAHHHHHGGGDHGDDDHGGGDDGDDGHDFIIKSSPDPPGSSKLCSSQFETGLPSKSPHQRAFPPL